MTNTPDLDPESFLHDYAHEKSHEIYNQLLSLDERMSADPAGSLINVHKGEINKIIDSLKDAMNILEGRPFLIAILKSPDIDTWIREISRKLMQY